MRLVHHRVVAFVRRHKFLVAGAILTLVYLALVVAGAIPGLVFPVYIGLVVLGAVPAVAFPIYYSVMTRWWRMPPGRRRETAEHLLTFSTLFALLYARGGLNLSTPGGRYAVMHQSAAGGAFLMVLAALALFVGWQRLWLFHQGRKERGEVIDG